MIRNFFEWLKQPMGRIAVLIAALSLFSLVAFGIFYTQQSPEQPIQFTHQITCESGGSMFVLSSRRITRTFARVANTHKVLGMSSADRKDKYKPKTGSFERLCFE